MLIRETVFLAKNTVCAKVLTLKQTIFRKIAEMFNATFNYSERKSWHFICTIL